MRRRTSSLLAGALAALTAAAGLQAPAQASGPEPGTPEYQARDTQNIADAYGRITGPNGQLRNPAYLPALATQVPPEHLARLLEQAANPTRPAITPGTVFPGWDVGNPLRAGWNGTRGLSRRVSFTNKYGALLHGTVYKPLPGAVDPYTGRTLKGPFPGVVITTGSVQGSEGMYRWLAQDLAERGYVVLTYDVQGQGAGETFPHEGGGPVDALPFCNPFATPQDGEMSGCPGVPSQQLSNFTVGTRNATSFFTSTPDRPYANPGKGEAKVDAFNPYWRSFDRRPDKRPFTPGRTTRLAIIGHSLGAAAVSVVQEDDRRVAAVVGLDKLSASKDAGPVATGAKPVVPGLSVQSEYGFTVAPWFLSGGSSLNPEPSPNGPDPRRERRTGFEPWRKAGVDTMLVVPRASTHLDYTDIPLVLPASRWGQALTSRYVQGWLDHYLKHRDTRSTLLAERLRYLEPVGNGRWSPVTLRTRSLMSYQFCSAYSFRQAGHRYADPDVTGVGCR
jgi:dienelactone hydrolase